MNTNFNYLLGLILAFVSTLLLAPLVIYLLKKEKVKQTILHYVDNHASKAGTPTMGGIIFIVTISLLSIWLSGGDKSLTNVLIIVFFGYGLVGFLDDFIKFKFKRNLGLRAYQKIIFQVAISAIVAVFVYKSPLIGSTLYVPFVNKMIDVGVWIIPITMIVFLASSNSVNLIDGLDGLSASTVIVYTLSFIFILFIFIMDRIAGASQIVLAEYKSLILVCCIVVGALMAFLLFNGFPAKIFMGDTGSLALGSFVASVAIFTKSTLYIPLLGIAFVITALSVIIQVAYYKLTKKRVFLMAPLHHHFERKGYHEVKIVSWYAVLSMVAGIIVVMIELV